MTTHLLLPPYPLNLGPSTQPLGPLRLNRGNVLARDCIYTCYNSAADCMTPPYDYVRDIAGRRNGTGPISVRDSRGVSALFNSATSDFAESNNKILFSNYRQITVCAWINADAYGGGSAIIPITATTNVTSNPGVWMSTGSATGFEVAFHDSVGNTPIAFFPFPSAGTWAHIAAVYDFQANSFANGIKFYTNGIPKTITSTTNSWAAGAFADSQLWIGSLAGTSDFFSGRFQNVALFKRALTAYEIASHMRRPWQMFAGVLPTVPPPPVAVFEPWWAMPTAWPN